MTDQAKVELRARIGRLISAMTVAERAAAGAAVCGLLRGQLGASGLVMGFVPVLGEGGAKGVEPDIGPVLEELSREGRLVIPGIDWVGRELRPARVGDLGKDLRAGKHGIMAPGEHCPEVRGEELAAVLVPGVAFDRRGGRLGRGGGFYDRYLGRLSGGGASAGGAALKIGVGFACQVVDSVPVAPHDCTVDQLVTPSGVIDCR